MRKMVFLILIAVCAAVLAACSAIKKPGGIDNIHNIGYGGEPLEFESFRLSESGMAAGAEVYEGWRTDTGAHLEYYYQTGYWDDAKGEEVDRKNMIHAIDGDEAFYRELCELLGNCRIDKWEGFSGANPPGILDGSSMSFEAVLGDGKQIYAYGSNNFPGNYGKFVGALRDRTTLETLASPVFSDGYYEVTLPESWVGRVTVRYSENLIAFNVPKNDGDMLMFLIIDDDTYGYSSDSYAGRVEVGRLVRGDEERFITVRDHYSIGNYAESVSEDALTLWESYEADRLSVIESLKGVNGYELYPEDGTVLYEADARRLASAARGIWLSFEFAGEYSGGVDPTVISGREYKPMFRKNEYINTIERVREKFLTVFSGEYTDRLISEAEACRDMIEYDGDVYVAYKRLKGEGAYNYWVHDVRDDGDGRFTVVMAVRKNSAEGDIYIDFPAERNASGEFVFTDYPYWDESE